MTNPEQSGIFTIGWRTSALALALGIPWLLGIAAAPEAQGQSFKVIYTFTGGADGAMPQAGMTVDAAGNLYGTTTYGGTPAGGTVIQLSPRGSGWALTVLHSFTGGNDGAFPTARVVFGPDGALYGTTPNGGPGNGGTVFKLTRPPTICKTTLCPWTETVLYSFTGNLDGLNPGYGDLAFDAAGNIYGSTQAGGSAAGCNGYGCGTVFKLTRSAGGQWTESILHRFAGGLDGWLPNAGVIFDRAGNLYGTTELGGGDTCPYQFGGGFYGCGTIYQLTPSGSGWAESILHAFQAGGEDGASPIGGLIFDGAGNLDGTTAGYGDGSCGTAFQLTPSQRFTVLYYFTGRFQFCQGPNASLTMDAAGNLYGTTYYDGPNNSMGNIFTLANGSWAYTDLFDFNLAWGSDGALPISNVVFNMNGNLYGTASIGGNLSNCDQLGCGVVWEITP
jgi:uncharacterized repeat protein (TIGR03803 family)